jgi:hypothetical protein
MKATCCLVASSLMFVATTARAAGPDEAVGGAPAADAPGMAGSPVNRWGSRSRSLGRPSLTGWPLPLR